MFKNLRKKLKKAWFKIKIKTMPFLTSKKKPEITDNFKTKLEPEKLRTRWSIVCDIRDYTEEGYLLLEENVDILQQSYEKFYFGYTMYNQFNEKLFAAYSHYFGTSLKKWDKMLKKVEDFFWKLDKKISEMHKKFNEPTFQERYITLIDYDVDYLVFELVGVKK